MKSIILNAFCICIFTKVLFGQNLIAVQNGSNASFYNTIPAAVGGANNGDTIYIPGGTWNLQNNLYVNKKIHILGVGHNQDSIAIGFPTIIFNGSIYLDGGASFGSIQGVQLNSSIQISNGTSVVTNFNISRCHFQSLFLNRFCSNWSINECVINSLLYGGTPVSKSTNNLISNNIISYIRYFGAGNTFQNNIFLNWYSNNESSQIENCAFSNNVILFPSGGGDPFLSGDVRNCQFINNLFQGNYNFPILDNIGLNNITNQIPSSIFKNQSGFNFNYSHDYHLKDNSPGKNAGTDGSDIGIYGGLFPWKDGSLPSNPQIQFKQVSSTTDQNGNLLINMTVKAQVK